MKIWILPFTILMLLNCKRPPLPVEYPKFWVNHERVDYPVGSLTGLFKTGFGGINVQYIKQKNGCELLLFHLSSSDKFDMKYDLKTKQWTILARMVKNIDHVINIDERKEFEARLDQLELDYNNEVNKNVNPLLKDEKKLYSGFPEQWVESRDWMGTAFPPKEAALFDYKKDGQYQSNTETWKGGWYGGEKSSRTYQYFVGTKTFCFKGKPIFQTEDEAMMDRTYVTYDFRTVIYFHGRGTLKFDIMDLSEYWKGEEKNNAAKPALNADHSPSSR